jgi:hypothetical protein
MQVDYPIIGAKKAYWTNADDCNKIYYMEIQMFMAKTVVQFFMLLINIRNTKSNFCRNKDSYNIQIRT